jgi:hypothetical protein
MFSKSNKESKQPNNLEIQDLMIKDSSLNQQEINTNTDEDQPQIVRLVEKISLILSPYFIVIVGLYLYDENFLFGTILIFVGILSLFKISYKDIQNWIEQIKSFLTNSSESNN